MAEIKFMLQGVTKERNYNKLIYDMLFNSKYNKYEFHTAYLSENAVFSLEDLLRVAGRKLKFYVGVSNGVTSYEAIKRLFDTGVCIYVVEVNSKTLYHPKYYYGANDDHVKLIIGSGNFTGGGMFTNIEVATIMEFDLKKEEDEIAFKLLKVQSDTLIHKNEEYIYEITSLEQINNLVAEGKLIFEKDRKKTRNGIKKKTVNATDKNEKFCLDVEYPPYIPRADSITSIKTINENMTGFSKLDIKEVWSFSGLSNRDLNIPTDVKKTHATGSMALKKGDYKHIDQRHYFREKLFVENNWKNSNTKFPHLEYTTIMCHILINDEMHGPFNMKLKHDPRTDTSTYTQNNSVTHLSWGDALSLIRNEEYIGKRIILYKYVDNLEYIIEISD